jgi:hypothetical protein
MLFNVGTVGGLTDGQLLERFTAQGGEAAELAFTTLVQRHGPMVLRVWRSVLRDPHEAHDAFQATFLVLVHRAGSLWVRDFAGSLAASGCVPRCVVRPSGRDAAAPARAAGGRIVRPRCLACTDVALPERRQVIEQLAAQSKGNYDKIETWHGSYSYILRQYLDQQFVAQFLAGATSLGGKPTVVEPASS